MPGQRKNISWVGEQEKESSGFVQRLCMMLASTLATDIRGACVARIRPMWEEKKAQEEKKKTFC